MIFVKLDESNIEKYIEYLEHALAVEPEQMHVDKIDKEGLRERIKDSFFRKTTSVLAMENAKVLGRIEYHFMAVCRMAIIWLILTGFMFCRSTGTEVSLKVYLKKWKRTAEKMASTNITSSEPQMPMQISFITALQRWN